METQLFTWDALAGMAGASLATFLFVQLTKSIMDRVAPWLPTDLYAAFIAFAVLFMAAVKIGDADPLDWSVYVLSFFNGLLVWATAGKMYSVAVDPPKVGKKGGRI
jgi:Na+-transporting NADH:ubiquinone oxidoreductase subunit NqrB